MSFLMTDFALWLSFRLHLDRETSLPEQVHEVPFDWITHLRQYTRSAPILLLTQPTISRSYGNAYSSKKLLLRTRFRRSCGRSRPRTGFPFSGYPGTQQSDFYFFPVPTCADTMAEAGQELFFPFTSALRRRLLRKKHRIPPLVHTRQIQVLAYNGGDTNT